MERTVDPSRGRRASLTKVTALLRRSSSIRFEQAVYGSFAFRDQGYAMLAQSPGCRPEWLADFRAACRNMGERPADTGDAPSLFSLRLPSGPRAVVGVFPQGRDDRGRPGALAFHGLFIGDRAFRRIDADPFALALVLRGEWTVDSTLERGTWPVFPRVQLALPVSEDRPGTGKASGTREEPESGGDSRPVPEPIIVALREGRRVALEASSPIDDLAERVWRGLPMRLRMRASVATWAFGNANRFDLLATPRPAALTLDSSYVDLNAIEVSAGGPPKPSLWRSPRALAVLGAAAGLAVSGVVLALRGDDEPDAAPPRPRRGAVGLSTSPPGPIVEGTRDDAPAERRRLTEALRVLCARFGIEHEDIPTEPDPIVLMERFARGVRYDGPLLSTADRSSLAAEPGHDAALALRWHALVRRFEGDRPLPPGFASKPLAGQLQALVRSFHVEDEVLGPSKPRRSPAEVAQALGEALAVDLPLRPIALASRYPALADYRIFLSRLPRR